MTEKIDTQGMSGEVVDGCKDNVYPHDANGEPIYPPAIFKQLNIFNDTERVELKKLIMECLHEWRNENV